MAFILNIDTAVETASVCLANDSNPLHFSINSHQRDHASWLHPAVKKILSDAGIVAGRLDAIAVTIGPGSYTGLRVGLSAAKGFCFALGIPLISIPTLEMMAFAIKDEQADLYCPLIDVRRMEVFTAVYDAELNTVVKPCAMILNGRNFDDLLREKKILFNGNGSKKLKDVLSHEHALFSTKSATAENMTQLAYKSYKEKHFADLAYIEPLYLKEFYHAAR